MGIKFLFIVIFVGLPFLGYFALRWIAGNEPLQPTELPEERAQRLAAASKPSDPSSDRSSGQPSGGDSGEDSGDRE